MVHAGALLLDRVGKEGGVGAGAAKVPAEAAHAAVAKVARLSAAGLCRGNERRKRGRKRSGPEWAYRASSTPNTCCLVHGNVRGWAVTASQGQ